MLTRPAADFIRPEWLPRGFDGRVIRLKENLTEKRRQ